EPIRLLAGDATVAVSGENLPRMERKVRIPRNGALRETFVQAKAAEAAAASELHQEIAAPELSVSTTPASEGGAYRVLGFIGAGVALAATGAGIAALVVRANHVSKYNDDALCLPPNGKTREQNCGAERSAASSAQRASIVGFGAAGVLAVTSIVF